MSEPIRILIADDHPIFRHGLRQIIERDNQLLVVDEAEDGETALQKIEACDVDVAVLDIDMPGRGGFDIVRAIRDRRLKVAVVFLTMHKDERFLNSALDLEVKGYVLKDSALAEIVRCIRAVASGHEFVSSQLTPFLLNRSRRAAQLAARKPQLSDLTEIELRVLRLVAEYLSSKEIADRLCLSVRTIEHHRARISQKLDLEGHNALLKFAIEHQSDL
ncbi:MAG: response regulator transcription factor [Acidobacteria bacterium]|nr:response regulator transcription factor [Acidobacteriota bacterium]MCW5968022.1 response regulator transcription factor [Blastocatellales bacterium]